VGFLKTQGSAIVMTTHRPRVVSVVDSLLVLRNGQQVGFGPAEEMINAVRNLQVVSPADGKQDLGAVGEDGALDEASLKEATNDKPAAAPHAGMNQ
jgi:ABC-type multidrug transport system ATPase subunit